MLGVTLLALGASLGCSKLEPAPDEGSRGVGSGLTERADLALGARIYEQRCATCHGPRGRGDGPAARSFQPPPRDIAAAAFLVGQSDDMLRRVITGGGAAVGKSPAMPPASDLLNAPEQLAALLAFLRSLEYRR